MVSPIMDQYVIRVIKNSHPEDGCLSSKTYFFSLSKSVTIETIAAIPVRILIGFI